MSELPEMLRGIIAEEHQDIMQLWLSHEHEPEHKHEQKTHYGHEGCTGKHCPEATPPPKGCTAGASCGPHCEATPPNACSAGASCAKDCPEAATPPNACSVGGSCGRVCEAATPPNVCSVGASCAAAGCKEHGAAFLPALAGWSVPPDLHAR